MYHSNNNPRYNNTAKLENSPLLQAEDLFLTMCPGKKCILVSQSALIIGLRSCPRICPGFSMLKLIIRLYHF